MARKPSKRHKLETTVTRINARYGRRAVTRGRPPPTWDPSPTGRLAANRSPTNESIAVPHIPTGFADLDRALHIGGLPKGKISEIMGLPTSGKTTLALKFLAQAQAHGPIAYVDQARYFDADYAHRCGIDLSQLVVCTPYDLTESLAATEALVQSQSLAALVFDAMDHLWAGAGAIRQFDAFLNRLSAPLARSEMALLFVHAAAQGADARGMGARGEQCTPLAHHTALRLYIRREKWLQRHGAVRGRDAPPPAAACGVGPGLTARLAQIRCPQARLVEADVAGCQQAVEALLGVLEHASDRVEPHGWGAAYVDLGDLARSRADATKLCSETGRAIRRELGNALDPALGWDNGKFTAKAAAHRTRPGRLLAIDVARERTFLDPLPVDLLPLAPEPVRRLRFLGLRTLGQYAALPPGAVWQQFGRAGVLAQRCARGRDDRRVIARREAPRLVARHEYEAPLAEEARLHIALQRLITPLLRELRETLRACGLVRLTMRYENDLTLVHTRAFVVPTTSKSRLSGALEQLAARDAWPAPVVALEVALEDLQDAMGQMEQLSFLPTEDEREAKLRRVQRYLAARFGTNCLRRAILTQPNAPLSEWRVGWDEAGHTPEDDEPI